MKKNTLFNITLVTQVTVHIGQMAFSGSYCCESNKEVQSHYAKWLNQNTDKNIFHLQEQSENHSLFI